LTEPDTREIASTVALREVAPDAAICLIGCTCELHIGLAVKPQRFTQRKQLKNADPRVVLIWKYDDGKYDTEYGSNELATRSISEGLAFLPTRCPRHRRTQ
jgi:hypothetical protein